MPDEAPLLDLSALDFRPSWAKESASPGAAPVRREEPRPPRPEDPRGPRGPQRDGPPGRDSNRRPPPGRDRQGFRGPPPRDKFRGPPRDERPAPPENPFPWLRIAFTATTPAVETVVQQVRHTGKTFSLFDIARILLRNPASYTIDLSAAPKPPEGPFHVVKADGSVWLSAAAAARHLLRTKLDEFYRAETVEVEAPKGNFSVVAVCGMSGTLLGPPNLHDFERRVRELHREKFGRMDFEQFRSRLRMERNPEVIEKWRAAASQVVEYYPREGENPAKLADLAAVEKHFLEHQAASLIDGVAMAPIPGDPKSVVVDSALVPLLNYARDEETRFPLRLAQSLSRALSGAGLRFHKAANRTTFVSGARARYLDLSAVAVSDSIRQILEAIRGKKTLRRGQLLDLLAPLPVPLAETPGVEEAADAVRPKTPEELARDVVVQNLLWLTHEGYVVEYADGRLESVPPPNHPPKPSEPTAAPTVEAPAQQQQPEA
ncbi:MAG: hypothetical protein ACOYOL_07405 [Chthoniobacterales bacterium]